MRCIIDTSTDTKQFSWAGNFVREIILERDDIIAIDHAGRCDSHVAAVVAKPYVAKQLLACGDDDIARELAEYGAWDEHDLRDANANRRRLIWIAALDLAEESRSA